MSIILPPNRIFESMPQPIEKAVGGEYNPSFIGLEQGKEGGLFAHSEGHILPRKGLAYKQAVLHNNIMKGLVVSITGALTSFRPTVAWLEKTLAAFNRLAIRVYTSEVPADSELCKECGQHTAGKLVRSDFMKFKYYNKASQEIWHLVSFFLRYLGITNGTAYDTGKLGATLMEYEPVYLLRLQDLFNEANESELIAHPRKELKRLLKLYLEREKYKGNFGTEASLKFLAMFSLLSLVLLIPPIKKAFCFTVKSANWDKLRMDEIDIYWAMLYPFYDYFGEDLDSRHEKFKAYCNNRGYPVEFT